MCSRNAKGIGHIIILFKNERSIGRGNTNLRLTVGKGKSESQNRSLRPRTFSFAFINLLLWAEISSVQYCLHSHH